MQQVEDGAIEKSRKVGYVRLDDSEYARLEEDSISTGMTIPALLKERYFKSPRPLPLLSRADVSQFFGQMGRMANDLNVLQRALNSGIRAGFVPQLDEITKTFTDLMGFMSSKYCRCKRKS